MLVVGADKIALWTGFWLRWSWKKCKCRILDEKRFLGSGTSSIITHMAFTCLKVKVLSTDKIWGAPSFMESSVSFTWRGIRLWKDKTDVSGGGHWSRKIGWGSLVILIGIGLFQQQQRAKNEIEWGMGTLLFCYYNHSQKSSKICRCSHLLATTSLANQWKSPVQHVLPTQPFWQIQKCVWV